MRCGSTRGGVCPATRSLLPASQTGAVGDVHVVANLFQNNAQDVRLGPSPAELPSAIRGNCFRGLGPFGAGIAGFGVSGTGADTTITDNTMYRKGTGLSFTRGSELAIKSHLALQSGSFLTMGSNLVDSTVTDRDSAHDPRQHPLA